MKEEGKNCTGVGEKKKQERGKRVKEVLTSRQDLKGCAHAQD